MKKMQTTLKSRIKKTSALDINSLDAQKTPVREINSLDVLRTSAAETNIEYISSG
jgi:hypothetical protein